MQNAAKDTGRNSSSTNDFIFCAGGVSGAWSSDRGIENLQPHEPVLNVCILAWSKLSTPVVCTHGRERMRQLASDGDFSAGAL